MVWYQSLIYVDKIKQVFFIFNTRELLSEQKRLGGLNLSGTYQGKPSIEPLAVQHLNN